MGDAKRIEKKGKNKLILFLSKYKFTKNEYKYSSKYDGTKNEIRGIQTPDAPTKYFINYLTEKNEKIDSILCITSKKTNDKSINNNEQGKIYDSAFEDYKKMLNRFCYEKGIQTPNLVKLNFDYDFKNNKPIIESDVSGKLCENIVKKLSKDDTIYIDYTSGIRDTSLLIILIIRYLEYTGIRCGGMIYSYYDNDDKSKNKIIDIKSTYDLFELLNGVNEFTSFGKSKTLSNYYNNIWKDKEEHKEIKDLINVMDKFSDMMSLCIVDDIDQIMEELNEKILKVKSVKDKKDLNNSENKLMNYMFFNLIYEIKKKFYLDKDNKITYISLIKWCLDNDLIQQALTLYVEKMPEYYATCKFYNIDEYSLKKTLQVSSTKSNEYTTIFYTKLFKNIEYNKKYYGFKYNTIKSGNENTCYDIDKINKIKNIIRANKQNILNRKNNFLRECEPYIKNTMEKIFIIMDKVYIEDKEGNIGVIIGDIHISRNSEGTPKNEEKFVNWLDIQNDLIQYLLNETHISDEIRLLPYYNKNDNNTIDYIYNDKINAIIILRKSRKNPPWSNIELYDLIRLMQDYIFFKIMRNQINHAKKRKPYIGVEDYLKKAGYNTEITVENIKESMKKSIEKIESIELIKEVDKIEKN